MPFAVTRQQLIAFALVRSGFAKYSRTRRDGQACILTFHGLREDGADTGTLDLSLHMPLSAFDQACSHLAAHQRVLPLRDIVNAIESGEEIPRGATAITFDDGYETNYQLAFPVLRKYGLPATIFTCSGFVDRTEKLWFNRVDLALTRTAKKKLDAEIAGLSLNASLETPWQRQAVLGQVLGAIKKLPQHDALAAVAELERLLDVVPSQNCADTPAVLRPMSWDQAREMKRSGLVEIEAHTHSHPVLSRCDEPSMRHEIFTSRDRITAELGAVPQLFAYTNGTPEDYTDLTQCLLHEAGFRASFTMSPAFVKPGLGMMMLPRYGAPESGHEFAATVSGAFQTFKDWRVRVKNALFSIP